MCKREFDIYWKENPFIQNIVEKYLDDIGYYNISFDDMLKAFYNWTNNFYYYEKSYYEKSKIKRFG